MRDADMFSPPRVEEENLAVVRSQLADQEEASLVGPREEGSIECQGSVGLNLELNL